MTPIDSKHQPPRTSAWFVELFASPQEADGILGDLAEEFSASVPRDGDKEARRCYRRHDPGPLAGPPAAEDERSVTRLSCTGRATRLI